jgi:hypothetical protein
LDKIKNQSEESSSYLITLSERTADAIEQNFSDVFFDVWKNKLKSAEDYFMAFTDSLGRMWSDLMGQMVKEAMVGSRGGGQGIGGLFGWLFDNTTTGSGSDYVPGPYTEANTAAIDRSINMPRSYAAPAVEQATVTINNYTGQPVTQRQTSGPSGRRDILIDIGNDVEAGGPLARSFERRYNIRPMGRLR